MSTTMTSDDRTDVATLTVSHHQLASALADLKPFVRAAAVKSWPAAELLDCALAGPLSDGHAALPPVGGLTGPEARNLAVASRRTVRDRFGVLHDGMTG